MSDLVVLFQFEPSFWRFSLWFCFSLPKHSICIITNRDSDTSKRNEHITCQKWKPRTEWKTTKLAIRVQSHWIISYHFRYLNRFYGPNHIHNTSQLWLFTFHFWSTIDLYMIRPYLTRFLKSVKLFSPCKCKNS